MNLLLTLGDFVSKYWFAIVIVVLAVVVFVPNIINAKKEKTKRMELISNLNKGTQVVTIFGVHGVVKSVVEKTDGYKYVIITTGDDKNTSTLTVRVDAIAYIDDGVSKIKTVKKQQKEEVEEEVEVLEEENEEVVEEKPAKSSKSKSTKTTKKD